ncbi:methyltransferase domain-containing protein [Flavobacterium sp.]|jgi:hypothetical protein|uniref:methyltransferase domain-containing protein n=1 Tax=Flavobacterium sp. TaxID=239 RepID=UPI0037C00969
MKLTKDYWENRYHQNETGWDVGEITTPLKEYIDQLSDKNCKILLPGGGNGHELEYLNKLGFTAVYIADFVKKPLENIQKRIPSLDSNYLIHGDFFEIEDSYDLIIEQTFFCALEPELREKYVEKMHSLLGDKGKLVGLFFQFPLTEVGPPFGGSKTEYERLFSNHFTLKTLETAYNSIRPRQNNELFFIFEKK